MTRTVLIVTQGPPPDVGLERFYENAFQRLGYGVHIAGIRIGMTAFKNVHDRVRQRVARVRYDGFSPDLKAEHLNDLVCTLKPYLTVVFRGERLRSETIVMLDKYSEAGCINVYPDDPFVIPGSSAVQMFDSFRAYSKVFTFSRTLIPVFYQLGARSVEWLPFGYDTQIHAAQGTPPISTDFQVSYFGAWGPVQEKWMKALIPYGVRIFGPGWSRRTLSGELQGCWMKGQGIGRQMAPVISRSQITVNMTRGEHGCGHSMKTFEIPACGGFMITNWCEEQALFFEDGKSCVFFDTVDELVDKVAYYLKHDGERERIRAAGMAAVAPHTYESRARALLGYIETGKLDLGNIGVGARPYRGSA